MKNKGKMDIESPAPFPTARYRFDQKNEMFKRSIWDDSLSDIIKQFRDRRKRSNRSDIDQIELAAKDAAWSLEHHFAKGNSLSNYGMYSWVEPDTANEKERSRQANMVPKPEESSVDWALKIKGIARLFGACKVGLTNIHPSWLYSHEFNALTGEHYPFEFPEDFQTVIAVAVPMDYHILRSKSLVLRSFTTGHAYSVMAKIANQVATFIRRCGYRAIPSGNDTALSIPIAMAAGLGEASRMGLLITPKFGPRVRLCKVFTDMPLAVDTYRPFGVKKFCETCRTCAKMCPSQAIPYGDPKTAGPNRSNHSGVLKWYNDHEKCLSYWARIGTSCSQCIRVCPFNKPLGWVHDFSRKLIKSENKWLNTMLVQLDKLLGYHRTYVADKFWSG